MVTCSCQGLMRATPDRRAAYCPHCDRPCRIRYCTICRTLSAAEGRGPRTQGQGR